MTATIIQKDNIIASLHQMYDAVRNYDIDIAGVSLHDIIKQCLQWIDDEHTDFALLVKFHSIYTKLIYLKLSSLLPSTDVEQIEEDISGLIRDIFDYKKSQELSQALLSAYIPDSRYFIKKQKKALHAYLKNSLPHPSTPMTAEHSDAHLQHLVQEFSKFIQINQRLALAPKVQRFSLEKMRDRILQRISHAAQTFRDIVDANEKSYHVVAAMLAILTLCAERYIGVAQNRPFDSIALHNISTP